MAFNGTEGTTIDTDTAGIWTKNYRNANPESLKGRFLGREGLERLLRQPDCTGIRFYYGLNEAEPQLLAVGVDAEENDLLDNRGVVIDDSKPCPPYCSKPNALNS